MLLNNQLHTIDDDPRVLSVITTPMPFRGSVTDINYNKDTHTLVNHYYEEESSCVNCAVSPWMVSYSWPCGYDVPRVMEIELHTGQVIYNVEYAPGKWLSDLYEDFISASIESPWCFNQKNQYTHKENNEAFTNG
jgi:hypothetical protein